MLSMDSITSNCHLILGGARSGKSRYAEQLAKDSGKVVIYLATAKVKDDEIAKRVARHQQDRPSDWQTVEEAIYLADKLQQWASSERIILVDCLTMWLMNLLSDDSDAGNNQLKTEQQKLLKVLSQLQGEVILVSNEVGMGIIPLGELTRKYVDEAGRLHQAIASIAERVTLITAGLPLSLKKPYI